ncbi:transposase [Streptomyces colonosanans]|uniref:transposase n=1 Tax=Streptomyces colonosanans TaxID=1428652 RepID=UPI0009A0FD29
MTGGEDAKYWQTVLTESKNRGVRAVLMLVCDGLSPCPTVNVAWPQTVVQTCIVPCSQQPALRVPPGLGRRRPRRQVRLRRRRRGTGRQWLNEFSETWGKKGPSITSSRERTPGEAEADGPA